MAYHLGTGSLNNLNGVRPDLFELVKAVIAETPVDFCILNNGGLRTTEMQAELYNRGASKLDGTRRISKHQKQKDGYGWAVDLVPWIGGSPRWEWGSIYPIAATMAVVSKRMGMALRWGGVWDKPMSQYTLNGDGVDVNTVAMKDAVANYCVRHPGPDFIDGPHYELMG